MESSTNTLPVEEPIKRWVMNGTIQRGWRMLLQLKQGLRQLDLSQLLGDATFIPAKKGDAVGPTKSGKGSKAMLITDINGTPLAVTITSASPHEVTLIEALLKTTQHQLPRRTRLIYDKAADSQHLRHRGLRLIAPFIKRRNRQPKRLPPADQSYDQHREKIERTFAWLKHFRRLTTRWEFLPQLHTGFWQLACLFTILRTL